MITTTTPEVNRTGCYTSAATARALGIHRNSLLKYTEGHLIRPKTSRQTGRKYFTGEEIIRFWNARMKFR